MEFTPIPLALQSFSSGSFVIVLDNPDRENEADLIILGRALTARKCSFLIHHSSGYICVPMTNVRADELGLQLMIPGPHPDDAVEGDVKRDELGTAYTISVDGIASATNFDEFDKEVNGTARKKINTGISAVDRAKTCRMLADSSTQKMDFKRPGHILPLRAKDGGLRVRQGHTEAAVEMCRLIGLEERERVGVIAELVQENGEETGENTQERGGTGMMTRDDALQFGKRHNIPVITIDGLLQHMNDTETKK